MKNAIVIKIALYVLLAVCAGVALHGFRKHYDRLMSDGAKNDDSDKIGARLPVNTRFSQIIIFGGAFFVSAVGLGLLVGRDVSHFCSERFGKVLYNDEGEAIKKTAYEEAEEIWAAGNPLEAIQKMRDFLKENPREQHVALRIAEIYEKDLQNPLAAALELEEVLKQKLNPEQWGWTAIHLCNIYNGQLKKPEKADALLRALVEKYGETSAAEKARKRLGLAEGEEAEKQAAIETPPPPAKPALRINQGLQDQFERFHKTHQGES